MVFRVKFLLVLVAVLLPLSSCVEFVGQPLVLNDAVTADGPLAPPSPSGVRVSSPIASTFLEQEKPMMQSVKVALLLPLSGGYAELGQSMLHGAQLALFDISEPSLELIPIDTKGTALGATRAVEEAASKGVKLILGPVFSESTQAVVPLSFKYDVNILSFSNDVSLKEEGIFLLGYSPEQQVMRVVDYTLKAGGDFYGAIVPNDAYGSLVASALRARVKSHDRHVANVSFYQPDAASVRGDLYRVMQSLQKSSYQRLRAIAVKQRVTALLDNSDLVPTAEEQVWLDMLEKGEDYVAYALLQDPPRTDVRKHLLVVEGGERLKEVGSLLRNYDLVGDSISVLGSGQWDVSSVVSIPSLRGGLFATVDPRLQERYKEHFSRAYGYEPPVLSRLAYDGVALSAALAKLPGGGDFSYRSLTNKRGFVGVDGIFRLRQDGITERGLAVMRVSEQGVDVVDAAPRSFSGFD